MNTHCGLTPDMLRVFATLPEAYLILSPDFTILTASNTFLENSRKNLEEIVGKNVFEVFPDHSHSPAASSLFPLQDSLQQVLATKKPHTIELIRYDLPRPEEQGGGVDVKYWQAVNTPVADAQGRIQYIIHKNRDITQTVLTEQFLIESRQREQVALAEAELQSKRLESILMQAPALICIFEGPSHVYKLVNPPYQKAVGGRPLVGKPIREAMPELEGQAIFGLLDQVYQTGETFQAREMLVQFDHLNEGKLGENYYNFTYQAIRNVAGEIDGILVFAYEVTDQVHARKLAEALNQELGEANKEITASNEELRLAYEEIMSTNESLAYSQDIARELNEELEKRVTERTEELSESNRQLENTLKNLHEKNFELDQFVYKTSHDLRAPLTTIMGLITLYKLEKEESARAHYISLVETRVHKLDKFIQAMLDYSRNTRTVTSYSYINFKTFVRECIDELEHMKHYSRMHFSLHIPDGEFYSDAFRLKIIFSNLISNAIKYQDFNKPESTLSIRVDFHPDQAVIHMEDNGTGIDQQYQSKLFDMFFRASEQSEGSGLGLYIVKQAVGMLNGKIGLQSKLGEGTTFIINLPRIPNQGAS